MSTPEIISLVISIATLIGLIVAVYKTFRDPDEKAATEIKIIEERCQLKHTTIDQQINEIKEDLKYIKQNHLAHIERDQNEMKGDIKSILAILGDRKK